MRRLHDRLFKERKGAEEMTTGNASEYRVYVGTYTHRESKGIYVYRLNPQTGELSDGRLVAEMEDPSFLTIAQSGRFLYAVGEREGPEGAAAAYGIDPATGDLKFLNKQSTGGPGPCHVAVDATGRMCMAANYRGGSVAAFPVQADGHLEPRSDFVQHEGSSINEDRQEHAHAHSVTLDPGNRFAFVCDLGMDRVMVYEMDVANAKLKPATPPFVTFTPGSGPRHFDWHSASEGGTRFAYVINELACTITSLKFDESQGTLTPMQTVPTLPDNFINGNTTADIHVHPSGRFVYGSNRGHDSIVIYKIQPGSGKLEFVGHEPTKGRNPRNFAITPNGMFLLAANQDSDDVVTFAIDQDTGKLEPTGAIAEAPMPVCLKFLPVGS